MNIFNSLHIYNENAPVWDLTKKTFEEQTSDVQLYYMTELLKLRRGVNINGVKIHPWLYWHINYWNINVDEKAEDGHTISSTVKIAPLRDNEFIINEHLLQAEATRSGIVIMGPRRAAKTSMIASMCAHSATVKGGGSVRQHIISGANTTDLGHIVDSLELGMPRMHPMFNLYPPNTTNFYGTKGVQFGHKTASNVPNIYSSIRMINFGNGTEAGAGITPQSIIMDEIGKFDSSHYFDVIKPALTTPSGWRTVPMGVGTGGDIEKAESAKQLMYNSKTHNLITADWDVINRGVKNPTWTTGTNCGVFLPGQTSIRFKKVKSNLSAYLSIEDEYLKKIEINVTDWENSTKELDELLEGYRETSPTAYIHNKAYYPKDVGDIFLSTASNEFPVADINAILVDATSSGKSNYAMNIKLNDDNTLLVTPSDAKLAEYPYGGGTIEAPVQIFIAPPKNPSFDNKMFVAGLDFYKRTETRNTDSVGAAYILQRMTDIGDPNSYCIAASYASRPSEPDTFFQTLYALQLGYGAELLQEAPDVGYEGWLRTAHRSELETLLVDGRKISELYDRAKLKRIGAAKVKTSFGLSANKYNTNYCFGLVVQYANEPVEFINEDGEVEVKKGVHRIKDVGLLQEMLLWKPGKNVDRIMAFGHALAWAKHLDGKGVVAVRGDSREEPKKDEVFKSDFETKVELSINRNRLRAGRSPLGTALRRR